MKLRKILSLLIAMAMMLSCIGVTAFAEEAKVVTTEAELKAALEAGGTVKVGADIELSNMITVPAGITAILDFAGYDITVAESTDRHIYALNNNGVLTLKDSVGTGSISARGIYNGYDGENTSNTVEGSKMIIESGAYVAIDENGGAAIFNCAELIINDGTFDGNVAGVNNRAKGNATINGGTFRSISNYAIQNNGGVMVVNNATVDRGFGAVGAYGGTTTINNGTFLPTGLKGTTCHVVYVSSSANVTINGGTFKMNYPADAIPDSGSAVASYYKGTVNINGGSFTSHFDNVSPVELSQGATISGGTYLVHNGSASNHNYVKNYLVEGLELGTDGKIAAKEGVAAMIGTTPYATLAEAITAAKAMTGDVTVKIYNKVTLNQNLNGSFSSIKFVGMTDAAEIYLDVQGYIEANNKAVAFENLKLSKSLGGYIDNAGFMNVAFGVYQATSVTYTNCYFVNGAYASSGINTFTKCTFKKSYDKYGLWAYGDADIIVDGCTFADYRGIKMYAEGKAKTTVLTVKNTDFSAVNDKPAIVLTYGESVTLEKNTYSSTGVFELDLDGAPNGTPVTSDVAPTCKNDNGVCGVLADGKIYTTVAQAAAAATAGSTVTLLHNSAETVELPEGVNLDKNGYAAAGVTVKTKKIEVTYADGSVEYFSDILDAVPRTTNYDKLSGATIKLLGDYTGSGIRFMENDMVLDLNSFTYTINAGAGSNGTETQCFQIRPEITTKAVIKNGTLKIAPASEREGTICWVFNSYANLDIENVTIDCINLDNYPNNAVYTFVVYTGEGKTTNLTGTTSIINYNNGGYSIANRSSASVTNIDTTGKIEGTIDTDGTTVIKNGIFTYDVSDFCAEGFVATKNADGTYGVSKAPNATVSVLERTTLKAGEYSVWTGSLSTGTEDLPLEIVMNFKANDTVEQAQTSGFDKWLVDFNLKFTGIEDGSLTAKDCYLAGNYGTFGWIVIPADGLVIENNISYPVVANYDATLNYNDICKSVQNFTAAIHVAPEILEANPNFKVELSLVMTNPEDSSDTLVIGEPAVYDVEDLTALPEVAKIGDTTYATLADALNAAVTAGGDVTVEILEDINLTGTTWTPVYFDSYKAANSNNITINGNDKTITGLSDMLFSGTWTGKSLVINNLTIADSTIVHDKEDAKGNVGVGAFIGNVSATENITLNKCHLKNSTVEGGHWTGGLIGYAAGYSDQGDGPVFTTVTIKDCTVTGSTITGKGSAGGVVGHATGDAWTVFDVADSTLTGNTITSTGSSANKAGIVMGTIGAAGTTEVAGKIGAVKVSVVESGNAATSNGTVITTVYGRQGSSTGLLTITGGTYENNPIEENASYAKPAEGFTIKQNTDGTYGLVANVEKYIFGTPFYMINLPMVDNQYQVSLYSGIDSLKYEKVGFRVYDKNDNILGENTTKTVYQRIKGNNMTIEAEKYNMYRIFGVDVLFGKGWDNIEVYFRPYAVDLNGKEILGKKYPISDIYTLEVAESGE